jgi:hypothetical protein
MNAEKLAEEKMILKTMILELEEKRIKKEEEI